MNMLDDLLKKLGVESYDDLKDHEKDTYDTWLQQMSADQSVEDIRNHIDQMKNAVIAELADEPEFIHSKIFPFLKRPNPRNVYLKARLKNYLMLGAFLSTPEQARKAFEDHLQQMKPIV